MVIRFISFLLLVFNGYSCVPSQEEKAGPAPVPPGSVVARLTADLPEAESIVSNPWVIDWMRLVSELPQVQSRTVKINEKDVVLDESVYYYSRYGSPLAYSRALDLAATAGFEGLRGTRVFDFGYGSIGHLQMMALAGSHAVGVDVAPILKWMYRDASGPLGEGSVQVFDGKFPKEADLIERIGGDFDLVISKNVLKRGYIHPSREVVDPRMLIDLGVGDEQFLTQVSKMLKPAGLFVIYNFCPAKAPKDKPYIPFAEGESPFTREAFSQAGFDVLHFDVVDHAEARRLGHALGWDGPGGMKLDTDLFAWYTIVRKKSQSESTQP